MDNGNFLIGRQPILNRNEEIVAYELLFRSAGAKMAEVTDSSHATASVILNTLTGHPEHTLIGGQKLDRHRLQGHSC